MTEKEVRLIDANALMELYGSPEEMPEWDAFQVPIPVVRQNILDMPTINSESLRPQWISVEDRLPDKFGFYLVASRYGEVSCKYFDWIGDIPIFEYKLVEEGYYTHWMPLPEHPTSDAKMDGDK